MNDEFGIDLPEFPGMAPVSAATSPDDLSNTNATTSAVPSNAEDDDSDPTLADTDEENALLDNSDDGQADNTDETTESESDVESDSVHTDGSNANADNDASTRQDRLRNRAEALQDELDLLDQDELQELIHLIF